jgi:hypothetical protein
MLALAVGRKPFLERRYVGSQHELTAPENSCDSGVDLRFDLAILRIKIEKRYQPSFLLCDLTRRCQKITMVLNI